MCRGPRYPGAAVSMLAGAAFASLGLRCWVGGVTLRGVAAGSTTLRPWHLTTSVAGTASRPRRCEAVVAVPGSKSLTNRALVLAALADGPSTVTGALRARDTVLMGRALASLGAGIDGPRRRPATCASRPGPLARPGARRLRPGRHRHALRAAGGRAGRRRRALRRRPARPGAPDGRRDRGARGARRRDRRRRPPHAAVHGQGHRRRARRRGRRSTRPPRASSSARCCSPPRASTRASSCATAARPCPRCRTST